MSVDRLCELRKKKKIPLRYPDGKIPADDLDPPASSETINGDNDTLLPEQIQMTIQQGSSDVDLQIQLYKPINAIIDEIRSCTEHLEILRGRDLKTADDRSRKRIMTEMNATVKRVMVLSTDVKNALIQIKGMNDKFDAEEGNQNSARSQVRNNLYQATIFHFQEQAAEFTDARENFRQSVTERLARQIKVVDPTKTDEEVIKMIEAGQADKIITLALASDHLKDTVQELRVRNSELIALQRSVEELYELFQSLRGLIESQGESLDVVEVRIARSLDYVQKGEETLKSAKYHQSRQGKLKYLLLMLFLVLFIIVMTPILITSTTGRA